MAITTISQLPTLNASLNKVNRASVAVANSSTSFNSTKQTGIVLNKSDLLEITLANPNANVTSGYSGYAYFSSKISIAELHANLFGKIQSINYYTNDSLNNIQELSPLSYNKSSYYKNGDRIFYLADQDAPLRVLRFLGSETQTLEHTAPKVDTIIDYVATPKVTDIDDSSKQVTYSTDSNWMYDNNTLDFNLLPLFAPLFTQTKMFNCYWLEASSQFTAYYGKVYTGISKVLHSIVCKRYANILDSKSDYLINTDTKYSALNVGNDSTEKIYLPSAGDISTVTDVDNYANLNIVIYNGNISNACNWLKTLYSSNNIPASLLNFWTVIYDNATINLVNAIPNCNFIPPRVFNNTILAANDNTKFLYYYCGNEYTNNVDGISLDEVMSSLNNKENKITSNTLSITRTSDSTAIEVANITNNTSSPIYNANGLNIRINDTLDIKTDSNDNKVLSVSDNIITYITATRNLVINSVDQLNNILTTPENFDPTKLTSSSLF